ncbi:hypothetical protein BDA96_06G025600 [Sorghum bicolor]|uniref:Uncharacterized protein n=2 Tax=Sorghum bicolor TaxID=4558 RepID=A0A921QMZ7_SORBI|nr:hypothetical protein BDA96_06G025600 [Sorghum bicolor]OQU81189.1 hypothetical protein SORBI_3006G024101 [Sorghum bicolor]
MLLNHSGATYPRVPRIPVFVCVWLVPSSLAKPKSEIFAVNLSSRRMFWGLMSQWMICVLHSSCKYRSPLATPRAS